MLGLPNQGGLLDLRCDPVIGAYPVQRRVTPNRLLGLRDKVIWFERGAVCPPPSSPNWIQGGAPSPKPKEQCKTLKINKLTGSWRRVLGKT